MMRVFGEGGSVEEGLIVLTMRKAEVEDWKDFRLLSRCGRRECIVLRDMFILSSVITVCDESYGRCNGGAK